MLEEEITLSEMLDDPIFHELLTADRISRDDFEGFITLAIARHFEQLAQVEIQAKRRSRTLPYVISEETYQFPEIDNAGPTRFSRWPCCGTVASPRLQCLHTGGSPLFSLDLRL